MLKARIDGHKTPSPFKAKIKVGLIKIVDIMMAMPSGNARLVRVNSERHTFHVLMSIRLRTALSLHVTGTVRRSCAGPGMPAGKGLGVYSIRQMPACSNALCFLPLELISSCV